MPNTANKREGTLSQCDGTPVPAVVHERLPSNSSPSQLLHCVLGKATIATERPKRAQLISASQTLRSAAFRANASGSTGQLARIDSQKGCVNELAASLRCDVVTVRNIEMQGRDTGADEARQLRNSPV